jgi:hypothetical protein
MGESPKQNGPRGRALAICTAAALGGGALAAAISGAQGPGDYQPSTTTTTTTTTVTSGTLPAPNAEVDIRVKLKGTKGKQQIKGSVIVEVKATTSEGKRALRQNSGELFVSSFGKLALKVEPGEAKGKRCKNKPKGSDRRFKLGNDFATITDGGKTKLRLSIPNKARTLVENRAICNDTKAKAKVRVRARDGRGNQAKKDRVIKMIPRSR